MHDPLSDVYLKLRSSNVLMANDWPAADFPPSLLDLVEDCAGRLVPIYPVDLLDPENFYRVSGVPADEVSFLLSTDSTNSVLMELARQSRVHQSVVIAEHQTLGRGRRGRSWSSPFGRSLSISIGYEFEGSGLRMQGISLVAGMAVCSALRGLGGVSCSLKWPNDVLFDGKKLSGILVEHQQVSGINKYVVGVGINIALTTGEKESISQPVCNVVEAGVMADRTTLAAQVTRSILGSLRNLENAGFSAFREEYESMHSLQGLAVSIWQGDELVEGGVVQGIGRDGALIVAYHDHSRSYVSGEVTVRRNP